MPSRTQASESYLSRDTIHVQWESDYLNPDMDRFYDLAIGKIVQSLKPAPDAILLDAGCGYCFHAMRFARHGLRVTGVDFSEAALREARVNIERAGYKDRIDVRQGNLLELPFPDGSFDYVNCWGVLMHIPELESALLELARVAKPGGKVVITENDMASLHVRLLEPAIRVVKGALGKPVRERKRTPRGIEEWFVEDTGGLMVRKTDMDWLQSFYAQHGLTLVDRFACQFTEMYTNMPVRPLKRLVYRFNEAWLRHVRRHNGAMGNTLIFERAVNTN